VIVEPVAQVLNLEFDFGRFRYDPIEFSDRALERNRELVAESRDEAGEWLLFSRLGL